MISKQNGLSQMETKSKPLLKLLVNIIFDKFCFEFEISKSLYINKY